MCLGESNYNWGESEWECLISSRPNKIIYLNLTEEDFVPDAVIANDASADFGSFFLGSKVEQPALHRGVSLAKNLKIKNTYVQLGAAWLFVFPLALTALKVVIVNNKNHLL